MPAILRRGARARKGTFGSLTWHGVPVRVQSAPYMMGSSLLTTKLMPPPRRAHVVARPRLARKLDEGTTRALTLISATAGFGKTTLVTEWLKRRAEPSPNGDAREASGSPESVVWLALDADDNTPTRLLRHVIGAMQELAPAWGKQMAAQLDADLLPAPQTIPDALINELNALPAPCVVILDDYHLITSPEIHMALGYAIEHLPAQVHLVLLTRADPPLPLARLRARDQLVEIRAADLAFTPDEAARFLNEVMGLQLDAKQIEALEKRTEGWIAGLQLAALSLRGTRDVDAFIENFTGNDRYIFDYLAEEVIRKLDAPTRSFLLETSILDRVCAPLGDAVTGMPDTQLILDRLERDNLFTIPLDTHREWYRYHHLFGELLRHELRQTRAAEIPALYCRAAAWYEAQGFAAEAIQHWLAAQEFSRAVPLIEQNVIGYLERAEFKTLLGWLDVLPPEYRNGSPRLALAQVWAFMVTGEFAQAEAQLTRTAEQLTDPADIAQLEALRALFVGLRGEGQERIALGRRAYAQAAAGSDFTRGISAMNLGTSYLFEGELDAADALLGEAQELMQRAGNHALATIAQSARADTELLRGRLTRARHAFEKILNAQDSTAHPYPSSLNPALVGLAELDREWNQLSAAQEKLERARINLNPEIGAPRFFLTYAAVLRARGEFDAAQDMLQEARTHTRRFLLPVFQTQLTAEQAALHLARGHVNDAAEWLRARNVHAETPVNFLHEVELLAYAQLLLAQQKSDDALILLDKLHRTTREGGRTPRLILTELLQALVYAERDEPKKMQARLHAALERAVSENYLRLFLDRGPALPKLLSTLHLTDLDLDAYRVRIVNAFPAEQIPAPPDEALPDALSDRELEILNLVAQGLSNSAIARELVLTSGTVKWHVNNIFGKLDVHSRTQAVARAREIKILA